MPKKKFTGYQSTRRPGRRLANKAKSGPKGLDWLKPPKFKSYLTLGEASLSLKTDPRWLKRLEADGRIPKAHRVDHGKLQYRLWSPEQVEEIRGILSTHRPGRKKQ